MTNVHVFGLGGTIAVSEATGKPDRAVGDIIETVDDVVGGVDLRMTSFRQVPSSDLTLVDLVRLVAEIGKSVPPDGGVVITQGTDTLEECAFALDLLIGTDRTIVVTGAMRTGSAAGSDGRRNVLDAIRVAAAPDARGVGTLVVFDGQIHAARFVSKEHTESLAAFRSIAGPVGWVSDGRVEFVMRPPTVGVIVPAQQYPPVALISVGLDDDDRLLRSAAGSGYAGMVVEGLGGGHLPSGMVPAIAEIAATMPVVLARGTSGGPALTSTYTYPGSEVDLLSRGLIGGGWLSPRKARVLLRLMLAGTSDRSTLHRAFAEYGGPDDCS